MVVDGGTLDLATAEVYSNFEARVSKSRVETARMPVLPNSCVGDLADIQGSMTWILEMFWMFVEKRIS